jgi:TatD DNase family protein
MLIDSHCHLNYPGLFERQSDVLAAARARGVGGFLNISTRAAEWDAVLATAHAHDDVWATIGIHPHDADSHEHVDTARLVEAAADGKVVGIGETGLDYYYDKSDRERQRRSFRSHLVAARTTGLPVIVHTRDAEDDTLEQLREQSALGELQGVIHCFTASQAFADAALELGFYISLSGIVTFKNAKDLQATALTIPADRLLVETDSPFLAPIPHRGKTCEPAFVADTATFLAALRGVDVSDLAEQTSANFFALFDRASA